MVKLDIFADPSCPWCYVGKTYLDRALEQTPDHPFTVEWHPFQLNPALPKGGVDRAAYLEGIFGSKEAAVAAHVELQKHADQAGVTFNFDAMTTTPNTLDAHRLVFWAGIEGRQTAAMSSLLKAYWSEGRDIGSAEVLCDIANSIGLDAAVIARLLKSDSDVESILKREAHSREMGVRSVPTYIVGGQHAIAGAQPTDLWSKVIADIKDMIATDA